MAPKLVDSDQKKREIIETTILVLSEKGSKDIRIVDIANKMNIGRSTIYEYFKDKDELLKESFEFFMQKLYIPEKNDEFTFLEELKYMFNSFANSTEEELKLFSVSIDIFFASIKGEFDLNEVYQDYIDYLGEKIEKDQEAGLLRKDINPAAVVSWIGATLDGIGIQMLVRDDFPAEEIFTSFLEAVESYLGIR